jgi:hypothetical protein
MHENIKLLIIVRYSPSQHHYSIMNLSWSWYVYYFGCVFFLVPKVFFPDTIQFGGKSEPGMHEGSYLVTSSRVPAFFRDSKSKSL